MVPVVDMVAFAHDLVERLASLDEVRVAILSDTHGTLDPRIQEVVADADLVVHGGDIGRASILAQLQPRLGRVLAVFGNNDVARKWPEEDRRLLVHLPEYIDQLLPGGRLVVLHGHQISARDRHRVLRRRYPQARAIVYGHSHYLALDLDAEPWVLNPGAAGRSRTHGGPSCMVLTATPNEWRVETYRFTLSSVIGGLGYTGTHEHADPSPAETAEIAAPAGRSRHR